MKAQKVAMLGTGLIGDFYTMTLHGQRNRDSVHVVYSRSEERGAAFSKRWNIPKYTTNMNEAINDPEVTVVIVALPNHMHEEAISLAAASGKAVFCTKPLARNAAEAKRILDTIEKAGIFAGYLEDLCYTPKTLKAVKSVQSGAVGDVLWVRSRETHPGPHSAWFWDDKQAGGGCIVDLGCHCIEIIRNFVGKGNRPIEVMCWKDTMVHPINAEDNAIAMIRFESGAIGQFEVSWTFRGGMDLRDEVAGTHGTIWMNHFLRTGFEMFTAAEGILMLLRNQRHQLVGYFQWVTKSQSLDMSICSQICLMPLRIIVNLWRLFMMDMSLMQLWMPVTNQQKLTAGRQSNLIGAVVPRPALKQRRDPLKVRPLSNKKRFQMAV